MRTKLGVMLMEGKTEDVAVQLYEEPDKAYKVFKELKGKPGDPKSRATFIWIEWKSGGVVLTAESRELPLPLEESPDGYRIGEGTIKIDENGVHKIEG